MPKRSKQTAIEVKLDPSSFEVLPDGRIAVKDDAVAAMLEKHRQQIDQDDAPERRIIITIS